MNFDRNALLANSKTGNIMVKTEENGQMVVEEFANLDNQSTIQESNNLISTVYQMYNPFDAHNQAFASTRGNSLQSSILGTPSLPSPAMVLIRPPIGQHFGPQLVTIANESNSPAFTILEPKPRPAMNMMNFVGQSRLQPSNSPIVLANGLVMNPMRREAQNIHRQTAQEQTTAEFSSPALMEQLNRSLNDVTLTSPKTPLIFAQPLTPVGEQFRALMSPGVSLASPESFPRTMFNRMSDSIFQMTAALRSVEEKPKVGLYTREERIGKIKKYKSKLSRWREKHPVNRVFKGRSRAANAKPRVNGRFIKTKGE
eukprot:TRINITY_DN5756_c0_g1_i3.p1 TRINITY_DN5756_c0_g1~~TRINITY_DN5756_c0_g1_i3.p1  ORF type:complete len:313 (-),score=63.93 TRINITY_DN5756_c0_g1_i3:192-1130(-)